MMRFAFPILFAAVLACSRDSGGQKNVTATPGQAKIAPDTGRQVAGRVASSSPTGITLDTGTPNLLLVDSQTTIVLDGLKASAIDLPAGTDVRASFTTDDRGQAHAVSIEARTRRGTGENAAVPRGQPKVE